MPDQATAAAPTAGTPTADAKQSQMSSPVKEAIPGLDDAPAGEVTLADKSGALGAWRAHAVLDKIAGRLAGKVATEIGTWVNGSADKAAARVLVVDDRSLLPGAWTTQHVQEVLEELRAHLDSVHDALASALSALEESATSQGNGQANGGQGNGGTYSIPRTSLVEQLDAPLRTMGAAVDLLGLLRTDYAVAPVPVSVQVSELATLTAARLARAEVAVEVDGFTTMRGSETENSYARVVRRRNRAVDRLGTVLGALAPVEAAAELARTRLAALDAKDAKAIGELHAEIVALTAQHALLTKAAGPARAVADSARSVVTDVDAALAKLVEAPAGGEPVLFTAVRRERLTATTNDGRITHVLHVTVDQLAADSVTRKSLLGTSGWVRYLGACNASWLLVAAGTGTVVNGGRVELADMLTFDLGTGGAAIAEFGAAGMGELSTQDPLVKLEAWARMAVVGLIAVLGIVAVIGFLAIGKSLLF